MKKLRILIDLDGIVADTLPYWLQRIANQSKIVAQVEDITQWGMHLCPPLDKVDAKLIYGLLQDQYFTIQIPLMYGAKQALEKLIADGHEIYLVTARHGPVSMPQTIEWVKKHLPFIDAEKQIIFAYNKRLIPADVIIDDKAETLIEYGYHHPKALRMAIKYEYNKWTAEHGVKLFDGHPDLTNTWGSMYGYLRAYAEKE